jgi:hypothetical protein
MSFNTGQAAGCAATNTRCLLSIPAFRFLIPGGSSETLEQARDRWLADHGMTKTDLERFRYV